MSETLKRIQALVRRGEVDFSVHGQEELANDAINAWDVLAGVDDAIVVEDYPDYWKGPAVLVLQRDIMGSVIHIVWGIERGKEGPAIVVTGYRPTPERWTDDFLRRRK